MQFKKFTLGLLTVSVILMNAISAAAQCADPVVNNPVIASNGTGATVSWDTSASAVRYEYTISTSPNPATVGTITTNQSIYVQGLQAGTTYYVCLRRICVNNDLSGWVCRPFSTPTTSIANISTGTTALNAYPNPVKDILTVELNSYPGNITITNIIGNVVYRGKTNSDKPTINMQGFSSGVYLLKYSSASGIQTTKIFKQ